MECRVRSFRNEERIFNRKEWREEGERRLNPACRKKFIWVLCATEKLLSLLCSAFCSPFRAQFLSVFFCSSNSSYLFLFIFYVSLSLLLVFGVPSCTELARLDTLGTHTQPFAHIRQSQTKTRSRHEKWEIKSFHWIYIGCGRMFDKIQSFAHAHCHDSKRLFSAQLIYTPHEVLRCSAVKVNETREIYQRLTSRTLPLFIHADSRA